MASKIFNLQFLRDGLVGIFVTIIFLMCLTALVGGVLVLFGWLEPLLEFTADFPSEFIINPLPFVIFLAFVGTGVGGLLLEKTTTRADWAGSIFLTLLFICGFGVIVSPFFIAMGTPVTNPLELLGGLLFGGLFAIQIICPGSIFIALLGFVPLWALAAVAKPEKRVYKVIIGALASSALGLGMSSMILVMQFFFA